jgi:glycosyltransferase involved in cell wall biosynthesis
MQKLKILHTCEFYHPNVGGAQVVIQEISERLAKRGHDVFVATQADPNRNYDNFNGVGIYQFPISGNLVDGFYGPINEYLDLIRQPHWDVMMNYALLQWSMDLAMLVLPELNQVTIGSPCGLSTLYMPHCSNYYENLPLILRKYDHLVFHSSQYRDAKFAESNKIYNWSVISNGIKEQEFYAANPSDSFRLRHQIPTEDFLILCVANITGIKGQEDLLEVFLNAKLPESTLLFVGKNHIGSKNAIPESKDFIDLNGIRKKVRTIELTRADVISSYFSADLFALFSEVECAPLVLYEAAAAGLPFLSTDVGNSKEIAKITGAGLIVEGDFLPNGYTKVHKLSAVKVMEKIYKDYDLRRQMGWSGRQSVLKSFTWEKIVDEYEDLYFRLIFNKKKSF